MDDFEELLNKTQSVNQEPQDQIKPDTNPKVDGTQPNDKISEPIKTPKPISKPLKISPQMIFNNKDYKSKEDRTKKQ